MPTTSKNSKSGNPAKKAAAKKAAEPEITPADDKYAPSAWGSSVIGGVSDLTVPSGQLCLVKRPGVEGLLREGVLRDIDAFTALVNVEHVERVKGKGKKSTPGNGVQSQEDQIAEMLKDPDKVANVMHTMDRVVCHVVVKPHIEMSPNDPTRRKAGVVYADMVDLVDKLFIFNFVVGGSADIERFLEESDIDMGNVDPVEDLEGPTE